MTGSMTEIKRRLQLKNAVCTYGFAFKEGHSVNVVFYMFSELFFDGSPGVAHTVHLLRTQQLHRGVTLPKQKTQEVK